MSGYASKPMRTLSWNIAHRETHWRASTSDSELDVEVLQEAGPPSSSVFFGRRMSREA
jgi:hypothetical protein